MLTYQPNISVCMATYNGEKFILEQLRSILIQLGVNDEVIISDDSSTDSTLAIISSLNDNRIKIFPDQKFKSPIFNFENALKNASGDFIFLSDQDDIWLPNKVSVMMDALKNCDLVESNCFIGDDNLTIIKDSYFEWRNSRSGILKNLWRNSYLGCCLAFHRRLLSRALPFPKDIPMHDMWLGMIAEIYFKPKFITEKLMIYRRHSNNATLLSDDFTSEETIWQKVKFRFNLMKYVIKRVLKSNKK